jgi:hypothetical protein
MTSARHPHRFDTKVLLQPKLKQRDQYFLLQPLHEERKISGNDTGASLRRYERCSGSGGMISTPVGLSRSHSNQPSLRDDQ